MEKEFIPYDLALRMKQLGFDEPCMGNYFHTKELQTYGGDISKIKNSEFGSVTAPTFSQAFRWFRDKFEGIQFEIVPSHWKYKYTGFYHITAGFLNLETMEMSYSVGAGGFETYEEAELACLKKLIEIVEEKL